MTRVCVLGAGGWLPHGGGEGAEEPAFAALLREVRACLDNRAVVAVVGRWLEGQGYGERQFAREGCLAQAPYAPVGDGVAYRPDCDTGY